MVFTRTCVHDSCQQDIALLIQALLNTSSLAGLAGTIPNVQAVFTQMVDERLSMQFPAVLVSIEDEAEEEGDSDFEEDGVIYPVKVVVLDAMTPFYQQRRPYYLLWRRNLAMMLRGRCEPPVLPNTPECFDIRIRNKAVIPGSTKGAQLVVSGFTALCHTVEVRERNA